MTVKRKRIRERSVDGRIQFIIDSTTRKQIDFITETEAISLQTLGRIMIDVIITHYKKEGKLPISDLKKYRKKPGRRRTYLEPQK